MKKFSLYNLLPGELAMLTQRVLNFLIAFIANEPAIKAIWDMITRYLTELNKSLSRDKKSGYTIRLLELDVVRDDAFIRFRDYVKSFLRDPDTSKREAAKKITDIIKRHGYSLFKLPYLQQSDTMSRLIAELKEPVNLEAVTKLDGTGHLQSMDAAAIEFETVRKEKVDEETKQEYLRVHQVFRDLSNDLKDLIKSLDLAKKANYKPEELTDIISSIEKEVLDATANARARETRKENEKPAA